MRISDWSSDVCSSDLIQLGAVLATGNSAVVSAEAVSTGLLGLPDTVLAKIAQVENAMSTEDIATALIEGGAKEIANASHILADCAGTRSEEHTSELQSLMRISYAVFCLKKKNNIS